MQIGTFSAAVLAKAMKKPLYVAAESYKFARLYPLTQRDLPQSQTSSFAPASWAETHKNSPEVLKNVSFDNPFYDYTPPDYIALMFTDLGVLTPSAVSDELIKLYQ
jgi:translation initiation factor eIF-2B subunit alpha